MNALIHIENYSEKSFVVFGDTKQIKDVLKSIGGKFNPLLKRKDGQTFAGWIFALGKRKEVEAIVTSNDKPMAFAAAQDMAKLVEAYNNLSDADKKEFSKLLNNGTPKPDKKKKEPRVKVKEFKHADALRKFLSYKINNGLVHEDYVLLKPDGWMFRHGLHIELGLKTECKPKNAAPIPCVLIKAMTKDEHLVEVRYDNATRKGVMVTNKKEVDFTGFDVGSWPKPIDLGKDTYNVRMPKIVVDRVKAMVKFAGDDELRPIMQGVFLDGKNIAATDAYRLAYEQIESDFKSEIVIPSYAISMLIEGNGTVGTNAMSIESEHEYVAFKLTDGKYPNYTAVLPKSSTVKLTVDRMQMIANIKQLLAVANKTTHQIVMKTGAGKMSAEDIDMGQKLTLDIPVKGHTGDHLTIGFNGRFLIDIMTHLDTPNVEIEMTQANRCAIFNNKTLLMPVLLNE